MTFPVYFDSKKSLSLFGLRENFEFLKDLYIKDKLPKVLMLSGKKGCGKSTLINHIMFYIFDQDNYNKKTNVLNPNSVFYNHFLNDIFTNIIYLSGSFFKNVKIEDIRDLKKKIYQTSISDKPRFVILDDVELFNNNSLNALLKIIEEPAKNNYFLLINNKSKPLIETILSRSLEIKIILNEDKRINIINSLINKFTIDPVIEPSSSRLTPGHFLKFNYIFNENKIFLDQDYMKNLSILLNLYKKKKETIFIDVILFLTNSYFNNIKNKKTLNNDKIIEYKSFVFENINKFFLYNLNKNALLNTLSNKIKNE
jgi:DNA polymerase III subunit delta'